MSLGRFNIAAGFSITDVIVTTWTPLVERKTVVMLFGSVELALEPKLTGSGVGCALWAEVGGEKCRVGLDGLEDGGIAEGAVVVGGEDIGGDRWLVVELTSDEGSVVETSMPLEGIMGPEGTVDRLYYGEIYRLLWSQQTYQAAGSSVHIKPSLFPNPTASGVERLRNRPRVHPA